jgi:hypothetical protein
MRTSISCDSMFTRLILSVLVASAITCQSCGTFTKEVFGPCVDTVTPDRNGTLRVTSSLCDYSKEWATPFSEPKLIATDKRIVLSKFAEHVEERSDDCGPEIIRLHRQDKAFMTADADGNLEPVMVCTPPVGELSNPIQIEIHNN